ncbi:MAG: ABC transporter substrate-binding protein [Candidatus Sumerlaeia bacterium]
MSDLRNGLKICLAVLALVLSMCMLAACDKGDRENGHEGHDHNATTTEELKEIVIGFQAIPNATIVAKDFGWHEETLGVPVQYVQVDSGRDLNVGLGSGSIHIGLGGSSPSALALSQGVPAKMIWIYDIIGKNEALVVKKDSNIQSLADLKDKIVAAPFASTTHYHLMAAFEVYNVDMPESNILDLQPPDMLAAWTRGDIDAGFVWEPTLSKMLEQNGRVLIYSQELADKGYVTGDVCLAHTDFLDNYPDLAAKYLEVENRAVQYCRENPEDAARRIARQFSIDASEALRQMQSLVLLDGEEQLGEKYLGTSDKPGKMAETLKQTADFLVEQKKIKSAPDLENFRTMVSPQYLEKAMDN